MREPDDLAVALESSRRINSIDTATAKRLALAILNQPGRVSSTPCPEPAPWSQSLADDFRFVFDTYGSIEVGAGSAGIGPLFFGPRPEDGFLLIGGDEDAFHYLASTDGITPAVWASDLFAPFPLLQYAPSIYHWILQQDFFLSGWDERHEKDGG